MLVSIILGGFCGIVMVLFNYLLLIFKFSFSFLPYFLSPLIAGSLTSILVKLGKFDRVLGTGATEFVEEIHETRTKSKKIPNLIAKTFATSWTYGSGIICGVEGPGILIGADIGQILSSKLGSDEKNNMFIGASACTGAILKAPITGALFCAELPYLNHIKYESLIPSILASTVAYLIFCLFFGFKPLIESNISFNPDLFFHITLLPLLFLFGIITGLIILIFMGILNVIKSKLKNTFQSKSLFWLLPLVGATLYAIYLLILIPFTEEQYQVAFIGPDMSFLSYLINNFTKVSFLFLIVAPVLILIAIYFSIGTFNSAGIILPLMLFGGLVGGLFGVIFYPNNPELFVILGISAVLGSATNNPIAAIAIIIEMTWIPELFIPAGITTIITYIFSGPNSIIPGQRSVKFQLI